MKYNQNIHITVEPAPGFEIPFRQTDQGWIGSDLAFSMPLDANRNLWLFGDTFIQRNKTQRDRFGSEIISNSVAVQSGNFGAGDMTMKFFWPMKEGSPLAMFSDESIPGRIWPLSCALLGTKLFVFAIRIVQTNMEDAFGFRQVGNQIFEIENPFDSPDSWRMTVHELPWTRELGSFGSNVLIDGNLLYIYGYQMTTSVITDPPNLVIARFKLQNGNDITNAGHWEFRDGSNMRWTKNREEISPIFQRSNTEFSVTYLPDFQKYILIANMGKRGKHITVRFSDTPFGPFTEPRVIYDCPEVDWSPLYFCYAVKAHPELSRFGDELIITYVTNSKSLQTCIEDLRIYYPRFLKLTLK